MNEVYPHGVVEGERDVWEYIVGNNVGMGDVQPAACRMGEVAEVFGAKEREHSNIIYSIGVGGVVQDEECPWHDTAVANDVEEGLREG